MFIVAAVVGILVVAALALVATSRKGRKPTREVRRESPVPPPTPPPKPPDPDKNPDLNEKYWENLRKDSNRRMGQ